MYFGNEAYRSIQKNVFTLKSHKDKKLKITEKMVIAISDSCHGCGNEANIIKPIKESDLAQYFCL